MTDIIQTSIQTIGKVARAKTHCENLMVGILCYSSLVLTNFYSEFHYSLYIFLLLHNKCPQKLRKFFLMVKNKAIENSNYNRRASITTHKTAY